MCVAALDLLELAHSSLIAHAVECRLAAVTMAVKGPGSFSNYTFLHRQLNECVLSHCGDSFQPRSSPWGEHLASVKAHEVSELGSQTEGQPDSSPGYERGPSLGVEAIEPGRCLWVSEQKRPVTHERTHN
jgi:hypothetical protein